jgi:hypothetical protein
MGSTLLQGSTQFTPDEIQAEMQSRGMLPQAPPPPQFTPAAAPAPPQFSPQEIQAEMQSRGMLPPDTQQVSDQQPQPQAQQPAPQPPQQAPQRPSLMQTGESMFQVGLGGGPPQSPMPQAPPQQSPLQGWITNNPLVQETQQALHHGPAGVYQQLAQMGTGAPAAILNTLEMPALAVRYLGDKMLGAVSPQAVAAMQGARNHPEVSAGDAYLSMVPKNGYPASTQFGAELGKFLPAARALNPAAPALGFGANIARGSGASVGPAAFGLIPKPGAILAAGAQNAARGAADSVRKTNEVDPENAMNDFFNGAALATAAIAMPGAYKLAVQKATALKNYAPNLVSHLLGSIVPKEVKAAAKTFFAAPQEQREGLEAAQKEVQELEKSKIPIPPQVIAQKKQEIKNDMNSFMGVDQSELSLEDRMTIEQIKTQSGENIVDGWLKDFGLIAKKDPEAAAAAIANAPKPPAPAPPPPPVAPPPIPGLQPTPAPVADFRRTIDESHLGRNKNQLAEPLAGHPYLDTPEMNKAVTDIARAKVYQDYTGALAKNYREHLWQDLVNKGVIHQDAAAFKLPGGNYLERVSEPQRMTSDAIHEMESKYEELAGANPPLKAAKPTFESLMTKKFGKGKGDASISLELVPQDIGAAEAKMVNLEYQAKKAEKAYTATKTEDYKNLFKHMEQVGIATTGDLTKMVHVKVNVPHPIIGAAEPLETGVLYRFGAQKKDLPAAAKKVYDDFEATVNAREANRPPKIVIKAQISKGGAP